MMDEYGWTPHSSSINAIYSYMRIESMILLCCLVFQIDLNWISMVWYHWYHTILI